MVDFPRIENIMATANLGCTLNLYLIASKAINVEYNPDRFNPVIMRLKKPKTTALIFTSGKIVVSGAKCETDSKIATRRFARIIQKLGYPEVKLTNFKMTNFVASAKLDFKPNFPKFCKQQKKFIDYEPELFPGVFHRDRVTLIIFTSGKIILTNAKSRRQIEEAYFNFLKGIDKEKSEVRKKENGTTPSAPTS
jgi:transcription initiation factor TFIID TATA-box-binding protein